MFKNNRNRYFFTFWSCIKSLFLYILELHNMLSNKQRFSPLAVISQSVSVEEKMFRKQVQTTDNDINPKCQYNIQSSFGLLFVVFLYLIFKTASSSLLPSFLRQVSLVGTVRTYLGYGIRPYIYDRAVHQFTIIRFTFSFIIWFTIRFIIQSTIQF